ncbi:hypothetical protein [Lebetimonas natsushimae]|uniref:hypothetical protein n=1 Tax=Lebetimonas natsushimae TaxID=1936991 RepID=UPI001179FD6C|nr:hypothetical protein [Lebetimonas natsushimae]
MSDFFKYIKKLLTKWFFYMGFLPTIYDYISVYLPKKWNVIKIPSFINYMFLVLFFIASSFVLWLEEKKQKEEVINKLKEYLNTLPNYKIKLILKKYELQEIKDFRLEKEKLLKKALKQLEFLKDKGQLDTLKGYEIEELFDFIPIESEYDLNKYISDLKNFITKIKSLKIDKNIENIQIYEATVEISNIGLKSDENIYCKIELGKENVAFKYVEDFEDKLKEIIKEKIPILPEFPKPVKINKSKETFYEMNKIINFSKSTLISPIEKIDTKFLRLSENRHPPYFFVDEHQIIIKDLNLNTGMTHSRNFYLILNNKDNIKYYITSRNLPRPIQGILKEIIYEI